MSLYKPCRQEWLGRGTCLVEGSGYGLDRVNCDGLIVPVALYWTLLNVPERRLYRYLSTVNHSVSRGVLPHERLESASRERPVSASLNAS